MANKRIPPTPKRTSPPKGTRRPPVQSSSARRKGTRTAYSGEIDRYNYVDRDIYSSSKHAGLPKQRRKGPRRSHWFLKTLLVILLLFGISFGVYTTTMLNRMKRADADTTSYIQQPSDAPAWEVASNERVTNILLIGEDKGDDGKSHRSDTTMLLSLDKQTKKIRLVSFLRDSYVEIPTVGKTKLNSAFANGGAALTMQTLENNFRVNIDKYVSIDFDNFESLIDHMGGIDIDMSASAAKEENKVMGSHLHEGVNHLNGKLALYYARIRVIDDDFGRTGRQRQVVESMISKMKTLNPLQLNGVMYDYLQYVETNLSNVELLNLISMAPAASGYEMETLHIPAENTFKNEKLKGIGWVLDLDIPENAKILREFLYPGETAESSSAQVN